jgi:hypothetical protein
MAKPTIVTRLGKGSELSFQEGDDNFTNLRDATISIVAGTGGTSVSSDLNGELTLVAGTGISLSGNNTAKTITVTASTPTAVTVRSDDTTNATYYPLVSQFTFGPSQPTTDSGFTYNPSTNTLTAGTFSGAMSYTTLTDKPTIPTNNNELTNGAGYITGIDSSAVTTALGFTPENSSNKNANNGYAGLDSNGKVAAAQLPSYVDDVIESADFASLPAEGETGKIYIAIDNGKVYRWSGSAYVEIVGSPGSTDAITEGSTNLYYTDSRARGAISAGIGLDYDNSTGVARITSSGLPTVTAGTVSSIDGDTDYITVNSTTGLMMSYQITFSGASLTGSNIMSMMTYYISEVDSGNNRIKISQTMGGSVLDLNTVTGPTDITFQVGMSGGSTSYKLQYNSTSQTVSWASETTPTSPMLSSLSDVSVMAPITNGDILRYDSSTSQWKNQVLPAGGISDVVADATPQLGGDLDGQGNTVSNINLKDYKETNYALSYASTITPDVVNGNVQTVTLTGNVTFNAFANPEAGQSLTLIVKQDATGSRTLTSTMKFAGGTKTLTTAANSTDIISVFYDGTTYWASLGTDFK